MMQRTENKISDIGCGIMQDLLISYCDGLTAETVGEMIQTHLTECPACQSHYEELLRQRELEEQQERSRGRKFKRKLARRVRWQIQLWRKCARLHDKRPC